MRKTYTEGFKQQAVEKVLNRTAGITIDQISEELGITGSVIYGWMRKYKRTASDNAAQPSRPQDWPLETRLKAVIDCEPLDDEDVNAYCRKRGIYAHHIKQWKQDFATGSAVTAKDKSSSEAKRLREENRQLKKELKRKEKALAEAAALLVLQKKANELWPIDRED